MAWAITKKLGIYGVLNEQRVKTRKTPGEMGFLYMAVLTFCIVVAIFFVYLSSRLAFTQRGYDISGANAARAVLTEKNKRLRIELASLKSPERIERVAETELGLSYPTSKRIVLIKK